MHTRTLLAPLLALVLLLAAGVAFQSSAEAACPTQPEAGRWKNVYSGSNSLARIDLRFICQDQIANGQPYPPGPEWFVQVHGRCEPFDCDWEQTAARRLSTGHIYAIYDQGFAIRYVYAQISKFREDKLWVYTWTDFKDSSRQDYGVHDWFERR